MHRWLCGSLTLLVACGKDDDAPARKLEDIQISGCKDQEGAITVDKADSDGGAPRECVHWRKVDEHRVRFVLSDLGANCGVDWQVSSLSTAFDNMTLVTLSLANRECVLARCSCNFDVGVTVPLELAGSTELSLSVVETLCDRETTTGPERRVTLTLGDATEGTACFE